MSKVFLGGTCNKSTWRDKLIPLLDCEYFNPVVEDWTPECVAEEIKQRKDCEVILYVITLKMTGVYAIAEVVDDSNQRPGKTVFCVLPEDDGVAWTEGQTRSLNAVKKMVAHNGASVADNLEHAARLVNEKASAADKRKLSKDN